MAHSERSVASMNELSALRIRSGLGVSVDSTPLAILSAACEHKHKNTWL